MKKLLIFGLGYTAQALLAQLDDDWEIAGTTRSGGYRSVYPLTEKPRHVSVFKFEDTAVVTEALVTATHILSSVPPDNDSALPDPVRRLYGATLETINPLWLGYLSATGVYGDTGGAWVDETSPVGSGRRTTRTVCDLAWQQDIRSHIFRLPGIYGPGRSSLDRVRSGQAHRINLPGHVFCRVHVADIVGTLVASMSQPKPGIYNVIDDEPASGACVTAYACDLTGTPYPPLQSLDEADLTVMGRNFYAESRRVDNHKIKHDLGVRLAYPTYREGIKACLDSER